MEFRTRVEDVPKDAMRAIAEAFKKEPHLLPITEEDVRQSLEDGVAIVALIGGQAIAFTRLIDLGNDTWELGSTWVHEAHRNRKLNHRLYDAFLPLHRERNILATTTNPRSLCVGEDLGFVLIPRRTLPEPVWRSTCVCPAKKIGTHDSGACKRAWSEPQSSGTTCWLRVTRETAERMHLRPARVLPP